MNSNRPMEGIIPGKFSGYGAQIEAERCMHCSENGSIKNAKAPINRGFRLIVAVREGLTDITHPI